MDKAQALQSFWSGFGLTAIDEQSAYDTTITLPSNYITYEVSTSNIAGASVALTASLWYKSTSWEAITKKADQIAAYIGYGGKVLPVSGGYLWVHLGATPFAQRMATEDDTLRRIVLNYTVEFLTAT